MTLTLRNPHSVLATLQTRPHDVVEIQLPQGKSAPAWETVAEAARSNGVPIRVALASTGKPRPNEKFERASAATAVVRERDDVLLESLWKSPAPAAGDLWLALDCLQDPHNVGAIFRTAAFYGLRGILLTKDRSAPMSSTVYDVASGGVEHVPFTMVSNLATALKQAKEAGLWMVGSSEHATKDAAAIPLDRPWLLVIGNEESGLRRLTLDLCDETCRLTPRGEIGSLNASVAAGILMSRLSGSTPVSAPDVPL